MNPLILFDITKSPSLLISSFNTVVNFQSHPINTIFIIIIIIIIIITVIITITTFNHHQNIIKPTATFAQEILQFTNQQLINQ